MKKSTLINVLGMFAGILLTGCVDDSYRGLVDVDVTVANDVPHEVYITLGEPNDITTGIPIAKGSGGIGSVEDFIGKTFHIYAFNQDDFTSMETTAAQDTIRCLVDGSLDDPQSLMGREARWNPETEFVEWASGARPIYYPIGEGSGHIYDFFAYYVDDMEITNEDFHRTERSVVIDVEIDGSQDLMSSKAAPTAEQLAKIEDEKERIYRQYCSYSYYTASRTIPLHPNFIFKHHLVKLTFKIVPGDTPGMTKDVRVEELAVESRYKGKFTVADKSNPTSVGVRFSNEQKVLYLAENDGSEFVPRIVSTFSNGYVEEGVIKDMGCLLVAPAEAYKMFVTLSESRGGIPISGSKTSEITIYNTSDEETSEFKPGHEYLITLTVYGEMDITVGAELVDWGAGGDYIFDDQDKRPGQI